MEREINMSGRKRAAKGEEDGRKARVRSDGGGAATDAEVEEFFAILRRIHAAAKYLGKGKRAQAGEITSNNKGSVNDPERRPSFEWQDFEGGMVLKSEEATAVSGVAGRGGVAAVAEKTRVEGARAEKTRVEGPLDLNTEPEPEAPPS